MLQILQSKTNFRMAETVRERPLQAAGGERSDRDPGREGAGARRRGGHVGRADRLLLY